METTVGRGEAVDARVNGWWESSQGNHGMWGGGEDVEPTKWELRGKRVCLQATTLEMQRKERI